MTTSSNHLNGRSTKSDSMGLVGPSNLLEVHHPSNQRKRDLQERGEVRGERGERGEVQ